MPNHLRYYQLLLKLYPGQYQQSYSHEMANVFQDILRDQGVRTIWSITLKELPASLWQEHYSQIIGGNMNINKKEVATIGLGAALFLVASGTLGIVDDYVSQQLFLATSHMGLSALYNTGEFLTRPAMLIGYILIGMLVAKLSPSHKVRNALIAGLVGWLFIFMLQGGFESLFHSANGAPEWFIVESRKHTLFVFSSAIAAIAAMSSIGGVLARKYLN